MLSSGVVLAEEKSALMRTGDLACNDLCRRWMSLGQPHEPVPAEQEPPTTIVASPATETDGPVRPSAEETRHVRAAAGPAATPPLKAKVVRQLERPGPATIGALALAPALRRPISIGMLPLETAEARPEAPTPARTSGIEPIESHHRSPARPLVQIAEPDVPATLRIERSDDQSIRLESVGWVGPADQGTGDVDPADAQVITGALSAATLLAMALLPLTSRPRRRGNPGLRAALRASRRRAGGEAASKAKRPAAATSI